MFCSGRSQIRHQSSVGLFFRAFGYGSRLFVYLFPFLIYPFNNISFCASIFITVALAYERYIAVCR